MYYNARWPRSVPERGYDPALGRFAQADTIVPGGVQGYDRYAYTNNNPIRYIDPSGHGVDCRVGANCATKPGTMGAAPDPHKYRRYNCARPSCAVCVNNAYAEMLWNTVWGYEVELTPRIYSRTSIRYGRTRKWRG